MHLTTLIAAAVLATSGVAGESGQIQVVQYPYGHDPETAWRITVMPDGTWLHEESTRPVKVGPMTEVDEIEWAPAPRQSAGHMSHKRFNALAKQLRSLDLVALQRRYAAGHTFLHPTHTTRVVPAEGEEYQVPAEVTRLVTHGDTYEIRISLEGLSVDSSVYAPWSALSYVDPPHPDREQILTLMTAWYYVLRAVGPIRGIKAKKYKPYLEWMEPSNNTLNLRARPVTALASARSAPGYPKASLDGQESDQLLENGP